MLCVFFVCILQTAVEEEQGETVETIYSSIFVLTRAHIRSDLRLNSIQ